MNNNDARNHFISKLRFLCFECKDELSSIADTGNESLNGSKLRPLRDISIFTFVRVFRMEMRTYVNMSVLNRLVSIQLFLVSYPLCLIWIGIIRLVHVLRKARLCRLVLLVTRKE